MEEKVLNPMPPHQGVGFTCFEEVSQAEVAGYRYEKVGRYHNYHVTKDNWRWPKSEKPIRQGTIDGFSPNLNKVLHIGHIRNLALASSLSKLAGLTPVSMLGASLGVKKQALETLRKWLERANYGLEVIEYDVLLPDDFLDEEIEPGKGSSGGCMVWNGPHGPVIVVTSEGKRTYAYHDLVFARTVCPDYYITGSEQQEHFKSLGLDHKHFGMGLVIGHNGKLSSRNGTALLADDAERMIIDNLKDTEEKEKLSWNIMSWNFLSVSRSKNVKFDPENWTKADSPGMYISYTYARLLSALKKAAEEREKVNDGGRASLYQFDHEGFIYKNSGDLNEEQINFLGFMHYGDHYKRVSSRDLDVCQYAKYTQDLSKAITKMYNKHKIVGSDDLTFSLFAFAARKLGECMVYMNMYPLEEI